MKKKTLPPPRTVGELVDRLRGVSQRLGARDRVTITDAIGALLDLSKRLRDAEESQIKPDKITIERIEEPVDA